MVLLVLRMFVFLVALAGSVVLVPAPAVAHGQLAFSDPAHQSTITGARDRVALYFTEKPAPNAFFSVTTPDGVRVDQGWSHGEPRRLDKPVQELSLKDGKWEPVLYHAGFPAMVGVSHWPQKGVYTIRYLSVASDGDRVTGDIRFDYQGEPTAAPPGWQPPANQADPAPAGGSQTVAAAPATPPAAAAPAKSHRWLFWFVAVAALAAAVLVVKRLRMDRA